MRIDDYCVVDRSLARLGSGYKFGLRAWIAFTAPWLEPPESDTPTIPVAAAELREAAPGCNAAAKPADAIYLKDRMRIGDYCVVDRSLARLGSGYRFQVSGFRFQVSGFRSRISDFGHRDYESWDVYRIEKL
ncbi:hypothetical protein [Pseudomonas sp. NFIX28]|uniref:hypothetical protein n=1 Tax=Pseudomonas sp. NFIX28 TaxID=1566235 RepID=UPI000B878BD3|nr:hypothetical protein [Pseudomonas sp. NFIX28]